MSERLMNEAQTILNQVASEHCGFSESAWFLDEIADAFHTETLKNEKPEIVILGEDFPAELAFSVCEHPRFLLGGSLETTHWSDALLPRDADPVSRSACGFLLNEYFQMGSDALIVLTLTNDNRRKLAGLLRAHGLQVLPVDFPPMYHTAACQKAWAEEMHRATAEMAAHCHTRFTARRLTQSILDTRKIRKGMQAFQKTVLKTPSCMSPALRGIILESVWYTKDRRNWLEHLYRLTSQIAAWQTRYFLKPDNRPWVMTVGSPVIFPNEKLPMLLEASGLFLAGRIDGLSVQMNMPTPSLRRFDTVQSILLRMAGDRLPKETSGAWTVNDGLLSETEERLKRMPIDGIVYHVLKGQIEYDFELPRVEEIAAEYGVPVFRLETDYQQQDVEQLRIRMEAFSEMLRQRNSERMRIAQ